jgi:hypothetical protein
MARAWFLGGYGDAAPSVCVSPPRAAGNRYGAYAPLVAGIVRRPSLCKMGEAVENRQALRRVLAAA